MLKFSVNKGTVEVDAGGSVIEIAADIAQVIHRLWLSIDKVNPALAKEFKAAIMASIGLPSTPVWKVDGKENG